MRAKDFAIRRASTTSITLRDRAQAMIAGARNTGEQLNRQLAETVHLTDFSRLLLESVHVFKLPLPTQP